MACINSGSVPATQAPPASAIAPEAPEVTIAASTCSSSAMRAPVRSLRLLRSRCASLARAIALRTDSSIIEPPFTVYVAVQLMKVSRPSSSVKTLSCWRCAASSASVSVAASAAVMVVAPEW